MAAFLVAVDDVAGGIEIEDQFVRRRGERGNELFDENVLNRHCRLPVGPVLEAAQGWAGSPGAILLQRGLQGQIVLELIVVVEVFVALAQRKDALTQHLLGRVLNQQWAARIGQHLRHLPQQTETLFDLAKQQQAPIRTNLTAVKANLNLAPSQPVKVDITKMDLAKLPELARCMRRWPVKLLAEKVESQEEVKHCLDAGFEFFQGYFFARPHMIIGKRVDPSHMTLLNMLGMILEDADTAELEKLFKQAPDLSYNLLRLVNSVASGMHQKISSLKQAVVILGQQQLLRWLQLLLFTDRHSDACSNPLLLLAARRGRSLELLAERINPHTPEFCDRAFMTGILSLLGVLLNQPLEEIVTQINLASDVRQALLERSGKLGALLNLAERLEQNDYYEVHKLIAEIGLSMDDVMRTQASAITWAMGLAEGVT